MRQKTFVTCLTFWGIILFMIMLPACNITTVATIPLSPTLSPTAPLPQVGRIAFYSEYITNSGRNHETYIVDADGHSKAQKVEPYPVIWSPSGQYIAFFNNYDLYIMDTGTNIKTRITGRDIKNISHYAWSPDSKKMAIASHHGGAWGDGKVYIVNIGETQKGSQESIKLIQDGVNANGLTWSPNGEYLAFFYRFELHEPDKVVILNVATGETILIFGGSRQEWSPDGKQMMFASDLEEKGDIYLIDDIAEAIREFKLSLPGYLRLTDDDSYTESSAWSPDGKQIVFASWRDGNWEIYVVNADGSNQTRLTNNPAVDKQPVWSPDGKQIAFVSNRDGNQEIYVMDADGGNLLRLTNNDVDDTSPVWQPQPGSNPAYPNP